MFHLLALQNFLNRSTKKVILQNESLLLFESRIYQCFINFEDRMNRCDMCGLILARNHNSTIKITKNKFRHFWTVVSSDYAPTVESYTCKEVNKAESAI